MQYHNIGSSNNRQRRWHKGIIATVVIMSIIIGTVIWHSHIANLSPSQINETKQVEIVIPEPVGSPTTVPAPVIPPLISPVSPPESTLVTPKSHLSVPSVLEAITTPEGFIVFDNTQPLYDKAYGVQVNLVNNPLATDPTWQKLKTFIEKDGTDQLIYNEFSFPCGCFAELIHNNAEAAGIKAAWVAVSFSGLSREHAYNAFQTTDKGLVFIDCTGESEGTKWSFYAVPFGGKVYGQTHDMDTVVYVELGKAYGVIGLQNINHYGFDYSSYEKWQRDMDTFNHKLDSYNRQLDDRLYVLEDEYWDLMAQADEIDTLAERIGGFYNPLGIVNKVTIYW